MRLTKNDIRKHISNIENFSIQLEKHKEQIIKDDDNKKAEQNTMDAITVLDETIQKLADLGFCL